MLHSSRSLLAFGLGLGLVACGNGPEKPSPSAPSAPSAPEPHEEWTPAASTAAATPAPSAAAASAPAQRPPAAAALESSPSRVHDVCFAMCEKLKEKCGQDSVHTCQINCGKYDPPAPGCEQAVLAALECQRDATDLVCANVAPESCAKKFRASSACSNGEKAPSDEPTRALLPRGFSIFTDAGAGFLAPMPSGVHAESVAGVPTWSVKSDEGALYAVRKLPRPPEAKVAEKQFMRLALGLLGRCSDKMKMQGIVDKPGRTSILYTTTCPDGSEERGLYWVTSGALFVASVHGAPGTLGAQGQADTFLYGFEAK